ncbi:papilin-like isoform X2 [Echeneis naucrates]|uniref:papilin-like isoform X2 n=1 Tax=Echeneis naucrates TaxID=173247 RepID=UPI0011134848|nr:papilin-like isoform X2 [Echeneis naucrates]XP_029372906.1 papilin-like isoform X2 [Echeneis naucrates]
MSRHFRVGFLMLCVLVWSGLAIECDWDQSIDPEQGVDLGAQGVEVLQLDGPAEVTSPESCRAACCGQPGCDLALVGYPADGSPQCQLVSCGAPGRDACVLQPSSQFKVYRRTVRREAADAKPHIVPLQNFQEPPSNETNNIRCRLPMKVGSCRAAFPKFYYDVTSQRCRSFIYGGCNANANNFESREACEAACNGVTVMSADQYTESCEVEPQVGPCKAAFHHWYYNSKTKKCEPFIFGGCRGNKNNYISKESCMETCSVSILPSSERSSADDDEYKYQCMVTSDPGPCRAAFTKFFYNHDTDTCQTFVFGGCRGNQNRYDTEQDCMNRCSKGGSFESQPRNIWFSVTLAALSALLLVTLVLILLRRRRLSRRLSSVSDKEELLPDLDEQSSVESLTVPESPKPDKA